MKSVEIKEYLYLYYKKRVHLIISGFQKMEANPGMEDIHKLRVQIKKLRAFFHFFEIVSPKEFKAKKNDPFKTIYKCAGKIREKQLNSHYLNQYTLPPSELVPFKQSAGKEIAELKNALKAYCKKFKPARLSETKKKIRSVCKKSNTKRVFNKSNKFIFKEAKKIKKFTNDFKRVDNIHKIRKHLKSLGAIAALSIDVTQNQKIKKLLKRIKKTEIILGNWHDKIILINHLEKFLMKNKSNDKNDFINLQRLIEKLKKENKKLLKMLKPKIKMVLKEILVIK